MNGEKNGRIPFLRSICVWVLITRLIHLYTFFSALAVLENEESICADVVVVVFVVDRWKSRSMLNWLQHVKNCFVWRRHTNKKKYHKDMWNTYRAHSTFRAFDFIIEHKHKLVHMWWHIHFLIHSTKVHLGCCFSRVLTDKTHIVKRYVE